VAIVEITTDPEDTTEDPDIAIDVDVGTCFGHLPEGDGLTEIKRKGARSFPFAVLSVLPNDHLPRVALCFVFALASVFLSASFFSPV